MVNLELVASQWQGTFRRSIVDAHISTYSMDNFESPMNLNYVLRRWKDLGNSVEYAHATQNGVKIHTIEL